MAGDIRSGHFHSEHKKRFTGGTNSFVFRSEARRLRFAPKDFRHMLRITLTVKLRR